ncbi:MAG: tyrosine-type recombinase/integrase [Magnetococcales bacterium]|nr:tyrosine-type recombinase/integrase [Magnetococcales bacterium]
MQHLLNAVESPVHRVCFTLMYTCGLRISEAQSLTIPQVDSQNGLLRIIGKGDKERVVPQGDRKADFATGMYVYHYQAFDLYRKPVVGLAILADESALWRPREYHYELWGTRQSYQFTAIKLMDFAEADLINSTNPFAVVTRAYLTARKTRQRMQERLDLKWLLIRNLYESGFSRQQVLDLFRFMDWVLHLPEELDARLRERIVAYEESQKMPYISSIERIGMEMGEKIGEKRGEKRGKKIGEKKGRADTLLQLLHERFGSVPESIRKKVTSASLDDLTTWIGKIFKADSLQGVFR